MKKKLNSLWPVMSRALLCILFSLCESLHASEDAQKFGLDWRWIIGTSMNPYNMPLSDRLVSINQTGKLAAITTGKMPKELFGLSGNNVLEWIDSFRLPANQPEKSVGRLVELAPSVANQGELVTSQEAHTSGEDRPKEKPQWVSYKLIVIIVYQVLHFLFFFGCGAGWFSPSRRRRLHSLHNDLADARRAEAGTRQGG